MQSIEKKRPPPLKLQPLLAINQSQMSQLSQSTQLELQRQQQKRDSDDQSEPEQQQRREEDDAVFIQYPAQKPEKHQQRHGRRQQHQQNALGRDTSADKSSDKSSSDGQDEQDDAAVGSRQLDRKKWHMQIMRVRASETE